MRSYQGLGGVDQTNNKRTRDNPVVGVANANGARIGDEVGKLFGKQDKTGSIIIPQVILLGPQKRGNTEEQGPSNVGKELIGQERDPIGAGRATGGWVNGHIDDGKVKVLHHLRVNPVGVVVEVARYAVVFDLIILLPERGVVVLNDLAKGGWVFSREIVIRRLESTDGRARGR
jgi:hypothetical protein